MPAQGWMQARLDIHIHSNPTQGIKKGK
ncbi:hypothetical protein NC653_023133 [Populus alba x Populus x berolinensis]|uniref:Uncharacterized protein n=1 Tax=Populus alba x Populus x berolinensis TaxID=444605 RepID=A0AAD6MGF8_9ROSI|nr:hypothetical protein NC653_023133 [Populus alba x Populus x berolinensis]